MLIQLVIGVMSLAAMTAVAIAIAAEKPFSCGFSALIARIIGTGAIVGGA